jgi:pilus assembly protein CpaC
MSQTEHKRTGSREPVNAPAGLLRSLGRIRFVVAGCATALAISAASAGDKELSSIPFRRPVWSGGLAQNPPATGGGDKLPPPFEGKAGGTTRVPGESIPPASRQPQAGKGRPRLPYLGAPAPLGHTPRPSAQTIEKTKELIGEIIDPESSLTLVVGRPRLLIMKGILKRVQMADENVATYGLYSEGRELSVIGTRIGSTVMNLWFQDPKDDKKETILSFLVQVIPDPEVKLRLEAVYKTLEEEINRAFPDSWICLGLVGDKLVVSGQAKDIAEATQILRILRANAPDEEADASQIPVSNVNLTVSSLDLATGVPTISDYLLAGGPNVVNLLRIPGEQQVNLRVTVAEINRTAARSIGVNWSIANNNGVTVFQQNTGNLQLDSAGGGGGAGRQNIANIGAALDQGLVNIAINALKDLNFARTLAEPNLVTLSGHPASFQAGGQFPVPVVTGFTGAGLQGVTFVPFGVQLSFTPYVTDRDRIRLEVSAEVSTRDLSAGTTSVGGSAVPNLLTRNFQTTIEMREGQTFAVAGLIQTNYGANSSRVPLLGDLPIVGHLWGFTQSSAGEQELVILVTPELVHPLEAKEITPLPGSDVFEPGDYEFFVWNRLESRRSYDFRSPVMTDIHRLLRYRHCDQLYILGPCGHSDGPTR